jgi:hypothetical protein
MLGEGRNGVVRGTVGCDWDYSKVRVLERCGSYSGLLSAF